MRNSLLTSNFLITLIKAMKKINQRFKMSWTDIESIIPSCNGAAHHGLLMCNDEK